MANVVGRPRAEECLRWFGESGWTPMEDGLRRMFDVIREGKIQATHTAGG